MQATPLKARALFLDAVAQLKPEVLQSLREGAYKEWLQVAPNPLPSGFDPCVEDGKVTPFRNSLQNWCGNWHLPDHWCREWVLATLDHWRQSGNDQPLEWCDQWWFEDLSSLYSAKQFRFLHCAWHPSDERWPEYEKKLKARFEKKLKTYRTEAYMRLKRMGEPIPTEYRNPCHFHWLAGYQVRGWSRERIGKATGQDSHRTVGQAINKLAEYIGLTLREDKSYDSSQTVEIIKKALQACPIPGK